MKEIGRLAEFLGVDPSVADTVAEKTNFSAMKELKIKGDIPRVTRLFQDGKANANLFRKGDQIPVVVSNGHSYGAYYSG